MPVGVIVMPVGRPLAPYVSAKPSLSVAVAVTLIGLPVKVLIDLIPANFTVERATVTVNIVVAVPPSVARAVMAALVVPIAATVLEMTSVVGEIETPGGRP